jgi:hypothetical protein
VGSGELLHRDCGSVAGVMDEFASAEPAEMNRDMSLFANESGP